MRASNAHSSTTTSLCQMLARAGSRRLLVLSAALALAACGGGGGGNATGNQGAEQPDGQTDTPAASAYDPTPAFLKRRCEPTGGAQPAAFCTVAVTANTGASE